MHPVPVPSRLSAAEWTVRAAEHERRVDRWTAPHRERRRRGEPHPVLDFLFTYYSETPGRLRRWHPGPGVGLQPASGRPAPHTGWRWYATDPDGVVRLDVPGFVADRGDTVRFVRRLLAATASRPYKLNPATPGELLADCLELAIDVRELDMRASPYDLRAHGYEPVAVETPEGRSAYAAAQRGFAERGAVLRARLVDVCDDLLVRRTVGA